MDSANNFRTFEAASDGFMGIAYRSGATEHPLHLSGIPIQTPAPPLPVYLGQLNESQNDSHVARRLSEFRITPPTEAVVIGFEKLDLPVIPDSVLNEFIPYNPNEGYVDDLLSTLSDYQLDRIRLSENESESRRPTLANLSNPDYHLTRLPAESSNPQDARSVAVVNPPTLRQTISDDPTNSATMVNDKSSQPKRRSERYRNNPASTERLRECLRELRKGSNYVEHRRQPGENPDYLDRRRERQRERQRERYHNDPVFAERQRKRQRKIQKERRRNRCKDHTYTKDPSNMEKKQSSTACPPPLGLLPPTNLTAVMGFST